MLALQSRWSGRDLTITASQSGKTKNRWGCEFRKESAGDFFFCGLRRVVIGRMRRAMLGKDLR